MCRSLASFFEGLLLNATNFLYCSHELSVINRSSFYAVHESNRWEFPQTSVHATIIIKVHVNMNGLISLFKCLKCFFSKKITLKRSMERFNVCIHIRSFWRDTLM